MYLLLIIIIILVIIIPAILYNNLVVKRNAVDNAYYSMDVMLKKRYDLIPMLVETVKGYSRNEKEILVKLAEIRQQVNRDGSSVSERVGADNELSAVIKQVLITAEDYPELKAGKNFLHLQGSINETEEQLAASRRFYNAAVNGYHNAIETFPGSIIAGWARMGKINYFTVQEQERAVPASGFSQ